MIPAIVEGFDASLIVGLETVVLGRAPVLKCDSCGHLMFEGRVIEAITRELATFIIRQGDELQPREVRFLRELMGMTQGELASRLGVQRATVNRWERGDPEERVGVVQSLALRTLAAWSIDDPALAREVGEPRRPPAPRRSAPPYRLAGIAA
jgi:DNA-binding XRE family transcriptional regulator